MHGLIQGKHFYYLSSLILLLTFILALSSVAQEDTSLDVCVSPQDSKHPDSCTATESLTMNHIFIGNPGVGKSTLLNCLLGRAAFKSGVSYGQGMTYQMDKVVNGNNVYLDTPGLEDDEMRKKAAEAITLALKQNGNYKVFFVVTLESGRTRPIDKLVIKLVLESCSDITHYTIIINKLSKKLYTTMTTSDADRNKMIASLVPKVNTTAVPDYKFLQEIDELKDENDAFTNIADLKRFVEKAVHMVIRREHVQSLEEAITGFNKKLETVEAENKMLRDNATAMEARLREITTQMDQQKQLLEKYERQVQEQERLKQEQAAAAAAEAKRWFYIRSDHTGQVITVGGRGGNAHIYPQSGADSQIFEWRHGNLLVTKSGLSLDIYHGKTKQGSHIIGWVPAQHATNQHWRYEDRYLKSGCCDLVMDVHHSKTEAGTHIEIYSANGGPNQKWELVPVNQ